MRILLILLTATITGLCAALTLAKPAAAGIDEQERVATDGAYAIIHYGTEGRRKKYLQIYVHDTKPDGRCAEGWADFDTWPPPGEEGHEHIDPVRAIACGYNKRGWSPRYRYDAGGKDWWEDTPWRITGLGAVDACWRSRDERDCEVGWPDRNWSDFETYEIR
jgi:hypothetical protein